MTRGHCADLSGFTPESILTRSSQGQAPAQSWGRMSGSARHPLAGCPVEGYICPVKQEAPMHAAPWTPGCDPCPGRCALPDGQALEGAVGRLPPPPLPHVLFQLGLRHSELSEPHPCFMAHGHDSQVRGWQTGAYGPDLVHCLLLYGLRAENRVLHKKKKKDYLSFHNNSSLILPSLFFCRHHLWSVVYIQWMSLENSHLSSHGGAPRWRWW